MSKNTFKYSLISSLVAALTATQAVNAAPGQLAQAPLYLSSGVQPNIFFMIDDSGSMDWEVLHSDGARRDHPGEVNRDRFATPADGWSLFVFSPRTREQQRRLCPGYNVLHYDPGQTYTPWEGKDRFGNTYQNQSVNSARINPYDSGLGTMNLSNNYYFIWNDANGDGVYQSGECPTYPDNTVDTRAECQAKSDSECMAVTDLDAAGQTNYANWFSYYRKREFVVKRALSSIITGSTARAGLATINSNDINSLTGSRFDVRSPIIDIDNFTSPVNATAETNKEALLRSLFRINSQGGTPLRTALLDSGEYYLGNNPNGWGPSPILPTSQGGECQQNFTILLSDGFWNTDNPIFGNIDGDNNTVWDGGTYGDTFANTLADAAMKYYETDMRPTYSNIVPPVPGLDENTSQHMVTFTVAFGVRGTLAANEIPPSPNPWPQPVPNDVTTVDDMAHAAYNGRGRFLSAGDPQALISNLAASIREISVRSGTATAVTTNSANLRTDSILYQTGYDSHNWNGNIIAKPIVTTGHTSYLGTAAWSGSALLDSRTNPRNIITRAGASGVNFAWNNLTAEQKADMCAIGRDWSDPNAVQWLSGWPSGCYESNGSITGNTAKAEQLVDYLQGDRGNEGKAPGEFRTRDSRLGDLVYSTPLFVGKPEARYPDSIESVPYSSYVQSQANRPGTVYVGGNDGMLHAFNSPENLTLGGGTPGEEVFAYIPSMVFSAEQSEGLHYLAEQTTPNNYQHRYYVDLSPNAADVFIDPPGPAPKQWQTVLIGGLRAGGKGLFALNITDPTNVSASNLPLWEFTDNDLGFTFSEVSIGRMNNGKWAAIFGNGYNNDPTGDGRAKLFIVDIETGTLIQLIDTGVGNMVNGSCSDAASDCNGLSTPAIADLNGDGIIDRIYAGDLKGNMWVFDVSKNTIASWAPAYGASTPLFRACSASPCTSANRQPITTKPVVARHPHKKGVDTSPNVMVYFGTGQFISTTDNASTQGQTFYGVWDTDWRSSAPNKTVTSPPLTRTKLQQQSITTETTKAVGGGTVELRTITDNPVNYEGTPPAQFGWYIDLPTTKERMVVTPHAVGNLLFFNTLIPTADLCGGGSGWLMSVSQLNGGAPALPAVDLDNNGTFDSVDMLGTENPAGVKMDAIPTESRFSADKRVTANSRGEVKFESIQTLPPSGPSRMSWTVLSE